MGEYQCGDCACLDPLRRCDGVVYCDTDEVDCGDCPGGYFACTNGSCIPSDKLCDGVVSRISCHPDLIHCRR